MTIWLVMGATGEYSDRNEWPVKAFTDKARAEALIEAASAQARAVEDARESRYHVAKGINPFDPNMQMAYTGTHYFYYETELEQ